MLTGYQLIYRAFPLHIAAFGLLRRYIEPISFDLAQLSATIARIARVQMPNSEPDHSSEESFDDLVVERSLRSRVGILLFALAVAVAAAFLAPKAWPEGKGSVVVRVDGQKVLDIEVRVGDASSFSRSAITSQGELHIGFPAGISVDAPVSAQVQLRKLGQPLHINPKQVDIALVLPDGRTEKIPSLRWNESSSSLEARRIPPRDAALVLALLALAVVFWVSEIIPLFVTSLFIPVILVFSGVAQAGPALAPFFNPIIVLFLAGFLMAEATRRSGLDRLAAIGIVSWAGRTPVTLFAAMMATSAFLSMWMSNTAAVAVLVPIAITITEPLSHPGYRKAVVLGVAYAGTLGGVGSAIGTPANQIAIEFLHSTEIRSLSFVEWFAFGVPVVLVLLPMIGFYLWKRMGVNLDLDAFRKTREAASAELAQSGRLSKEKLSVLLLLCAVFAGWLTQSIHGLHPGIVGLAGALVLASIGRVKPDDLQRVSWSSLLTFGGGLTLGTFLVGTGTSDWVATRLTGLSGLPPSVSVFLVASIALLLTSVASNTASAAILIPLAIPLAPVLGVDPVLLVMVVAITSSLDFALVIGTPPTMIAYSTKLFSTSEIFRLGIVLNALALAVVAGVFTYLWQLADLL